MDPREFQQQTIKWCSFHIAASAGSLADDDDVEQIIRLKLLTVDEDGNTLISDATPGDSGDSRMPKEFFPDGCTDPDARKAYAFGYAKHRARSEIDSRRWKNSDRGKAPHIPIGDEARNLETPAIDETCVTDAETIRGLLSDEEWELMEMRYYEGISLRKIAKLLNLGRNAIQYRHRKIMTKIREGLEIV